MPTLRGAKLKRRRDEGYALVLTAIMIIPIMGLTALAVDGGAWYARASQLERAADAAALAGAARLPNEANALASAQAILAKDGITCGGTITCTFAKVNNVRYKVGIVDSNVLQFFSPAVRQGSVLIERGSTAEQIKQLPMGSPRNYLGTGDLGKGAEGTAYEKEDVWLAVSGRCTDKAQGDQKAAGYANAGAANTCTGAANEDYQNDNYVIYVEVPLTRTYDTDVLIYNGNFSMNDTTAGCSADATENRTKESCPGSGKASGYMNTTFSLYAPDDSALDDDNNPKVASSVCTSGTPTSTGEKTFAPKTNFTADSNTTYNPDSTKFTNTATDGTTVGSGWWNLCRIPKTAPGGRYLLRVRNGTTSTGTGSAVENKVGSNAFSVVANRVGTKSGLCDSRIPADADCPKVFAKEYMSVFATANGVADFFLAEVGNQHAGRDVKIGLWDPAEGATKLRIRYPKTCTGNTVNDWGYQTFNWNDGAGNSGTNVSTIPISSYSFTNRLLTIEFTLSATWNPPACNEWFRIEYTYSGSATDRTTWSMAISGKSVRLVS